MTGEYPKVINLIIGLTIGILHFLLAAAGVFTFNEYTPWLSWTFVLTGPLQTLPASITAFFFPMVGGIWLVAGAALSFLALVLDVGDFSEKLQLVVRYCIPMLVLGLVSFYLYANRRRLPTHEFRETLDS
jgi:hypothetical protein